MNISYFNNLPFVEALDKFFEELQVPVSKIAQAPGEPEDLIPENYKPENPAHMLINNIYFLGMVNEHAFENTEDNETLDTVKEHKEDYDGLLIFGIELHARKNELLPTRSQLAEICRAFNREYNYTPVTIIFKYGNLLAFANSERLKYKQEWREGEKVGKISLLRDIDIERPHSGHIRILRELHIPKTGKNAVDTFEKLYKYWQDVFSVSLLNKKFYKELSNWYFWAIKHVVFPNRPTAAMAHEKGIELDGLIREHNATNVIRLLTRILFVWFIKEKKLIPEELFDLDTLQEDILKEISPYHETDGIFATANKESVYYKAILQNLFFASLNCPIKADDVDARTRGFRLNNHYGQDRGNDWRYRYENYFKNPDAFLEMINKTVPFLNGGLFECLDEKLNNVYIDGFSDQMTKGELLVVPDYLFFGTDSIDDISEITGIKDSQNKNADVKGLINILKSYKFTITENTPIEEDIELDPELLGKVFENLLASYNPETKTTARKQTGSFYTPREIVNYMVDESLIAYLKNILIDKTKESDLDAALHSLISYSSVNPFADDKDTTKIIINALDRCKILDPACGSGAFPMGVLQKMVHILQKLDLDNELWHELQLQKAMDETRTAYQIQDKKEREKLILEINEAFDQNINDPDYARKLYLIENCIYGVDIQPIAIQISKLRFFISLVSDQKTNSKLENFGIKPLPNLETRFVAANTLVGIDLTDSQKELFDNNKITELEKELKLIRHKLFSARSKDTKMKYRNLDKELRNSIAELVEEDLNIEIDQLVSNDPIQQEIKYYNSKGDSKKVDSLLEKLKSKFDHFRSKNHQIAQQLASWDPYDQNASSPFFDPEWMFDIKEGFDVVIGNPPYIDYREIDNITKNELLDYATNENSTKPNLYLFFIEKGMNVLNNSGVLSFINPAYYLSIDSGFGCRRFLSNFNSIDFIVDVSYLKVFEEASAYTIINQFKKGKKKNYNIRINKCLEFDDLYKTSFFIRIDEVECDDLRRIPFNEMTQILKEIEKNKEPLDKIGVFNWGTSKTGYGKLKIKKDEYHLLSFSEKAKYKPIVQTADIKRYFIEWKEEYIPIDIYSDRIIAEFNKDKLLIARVTKTIQSCFTESNYYVGKSTLVTNLTIPFQFILGVLNSKIVNFWYSNKFESTHMAGGYLRFDIPYLKQIPIPKPNVTLINLVNILLHNTISRSLNEIIDALVFNLYFPNHMQERNIDVLEFIEQDISEVLQSRDFEKLSDTEKEKVIAQLHQTWTDPENEVVKRMAMFKEKSPDILGVIMESTVK